MWLPDMVVEGVTVGTGILGILELRTTVKTHHSNMACSQAHAASHIAC